LQKVSAQLELSKAAPQLAADISKAAEPNQQSHFATRISDNRAAMIQCRGPRSEDASVLPFDPTKRVPNGRDAKSQLIPWGPEPRVQSDRSWRDRPIAPEAVLLHFWALTHTMARDHSSC
jgi:hypothetical protein